MFASGELTSDGRAAAWMLQLLRVQLMRPVTAALFIVTVGYCRSKYRT